MASRSISRFALVGLSLSLSAVVTLPTYGQQGKAPFFSSMATYVYGGKAAKSPDGRKEVTIKLVDDNADDFPTDVFVVTGGKRISARISFGLNAQVLWRPDSTGFAITGSEEGANGQYETDVFEMRGGKLVRAPLTKLVQEAFGHPVKCGWPEAPNVVAVQWLGASSQLVVAAQIISHSNCDSMGTFKAYVVDTVTQRLVRVYDQIQAKQRFGSALGEWLRDAKDSCIRDPKTCFVVANHPELKSNTPQ